MSAQENAKMARGIYEMFNNRDFDGMAALAAENMEVVNIPVGATLSGPAGFRQHAQGWGGAFPDSRVEVTNVIASDEGVVVEFRGRGTHTGPLASPAGEIPATGKSVDIPFCDVYQVKGGKLSSLHAYFDSATMLRQLGLIS